MQAGGADATLAMRRTYGAIEGMVMRQSMMLGQRWGALLGREIEEEARQELKNRGIPL